ncbi:hypothetical protein OG965_02850 [Streptomyces sp. NBC_00224]|uniref:Uncharacterized protein n=1 Tax=Streptomyces sp. NBC_00060 TaxID=2975636 RepID=A0AAU2HCX9_9ACTN
MSGQFAQLRVLGEVTDVPQLRRMVVAAAQQGVVRAVGEGVDEVLVPLEGGDLTKAKVKLTALDRSLRRARGDGHGVTDLGVSVAARPPS